MQARIMVVDDDSASLQSLSEMLHHHIASASVQTFTSPHTALLTLREREFDLVLSDFQMPGMNGISLMKAARENGCDASFILMTGEASEHLLTDGLRVGMFALLHKPLNRAALVPLLQQAIDCHRLRKEVTELRRMLVECGVELGVLVHNWATETDEYFQAQLPY